jgi:hypothetical protein
MPRKRVGIDGGRLIFEIGGDRVSLPLSSRPLETLPFVVRAYLDPVERAGFETLMCIRLGCADVIVHDKLEDAVRQPSEPSTAAEPTTPEANVLHETLDAIAAVVNNDVPGRRLAKYPQYKTPAYIAPGKELACFIRGLESALLPIHARFADWSGRARPVRDSDEDNDECWLAFYQGLNAASRLNVSALGKAWAYIATLKRVNEALRARQ